MSDSNRPDGPAGDGALSFDEGADAITDILGPDDFIADPDEADESNEADEDTVEDGEEPDDTDDDSEDVAADDEESEDEEEDGPDDEQESIDDQLVTMADGQQITVRDLRDHADNRIKEMQRTFTQKTTELSERSKRVEADAQNLSQQRDFLVQWFQSEMPQVPDRSMLNTDPMQYWEQKALYDEKVEKWQQLQNHYAQQHQQIQEENRKKAEEELAKEREALRKAMPFMVDSKRSSDFYSDAVDAGSDYGFTEEEVKGATDHRFLVALRDLVAYKKLKAKVPKAKEAVKGKPKVLSGSKRQGKKTSQNAKARADRLAKTGSMEAGIASLMDFEL